MNEGAWLTARPRCAFAVEAWVRWFASLSSPVYDGSFHSFRPSMSRAPKTYEVERKGSPVGELLVAWSSESM